VFHPDLSTEIKKKQSQTASVRINKYIKEFASKDLIQSNN